MAKKLTFRNGLRKNRGERMSKEIDNEIKCWWHPRRKATHIIDFKDGTSDTSACSECAKRLKKSKATGEFPTTRNAVIKLRGNDVNTYNMP